MLRQHILIRPTLWKASLPSIQRASSSSFHTTAITSLPYAPYPPVFTLDPNQFSWTGQKTLDISKRRSSHIPVGLLHGLPRVSFRWKEQMDGVLLPRGTKGVLYYQPGRYPVEGWLRFRCCNSPATFADGKDLTRPGGEAWGMSLIELVKYSRYAPVVQRLVLDGMLDQSVVSDMQKVYRKWSFMARVIYSLKDPFTIALERRSRLTLATHHSAKVVLLNFMADRRTTRFVYPYKGVVTARFEMSTFPEHAKLGPTLCLKYMDILQPVECIVPDYDGYMAPPRAGEYHTRGGKIWGQRLTDLRMEMFGDLLAQDGTRIPPSRPARY